MAVNDFSTILMGPVAIAAGIAGLLGLVFIILFFTVGGKFGTLNDIFIGLTAVLSAVLAWLLFSRLSGFPQSLALLLTLVAALGALVVVIGSVLVISRTTGWYLAGLYMAAGNGLIGLWLIGLSLSALPGDFMPQGLAIFGLVTGAIQALGLAAVPGIIQRVDRTEFSMSLVNVIWGTSALGWLALFPVWCILLGRYLLSG